MSFHKFTIPSSIILLLTGCAGAADLATATLPQFNTEAISVVMPQGILRGTVETSTATAFRLPGRFIKFADKNVTCSGQSKGSIVDTDAPTTVAISCDDGRKGVLNYTYYYQGQITFSDGTKAEFIVGDAAANYY
jgi:hypothetical protein